MPKTPLSTLERIRAIIESDITSIEEASKEGSLDRGSAAKLVDYAKLEIALQRHEADISDAEEAQEIAKQQYEALKEQVQRALKTKAQASEDVEDE